MTSTYNAIHVEYVFFDTCENIFLKFNLSLKFKVFSTGDTNSAAKLIFLNSKFKILNKFFLKKENISGQIENHLKHTHSVQ